MAYSSKDMAREAGMTTEGLRFYEKSGIIKVKKNAKNGYRVYEVMQVPFLRMAKILNTYGIPLHDIRRFFHKGDEALGGLLATMEQKQEDLRLELWRKGRILERLEYQSDLIRRAVEDPAQIWFCTRPAIAYLEYYGTSALRRNKELQQTLEAWVTQMPLVYPMPVLHQKDIGNPSAYCPAGFYCYVEDMEKLGLKENRFVRMVPRQQYLCGISRQDNPQLIVSSSALTPLLATAEKMNLRVAGDVFFLSFAVTQPQEEVQRLFYQVLMPVVAK